MPYAGVSTRTSLISTSTSPSPSLEYVLIGAVGTADTASVTWLSPDSVTVDAVLALESSRSMIVGREVEKPRTFEAAFVERAFILFGTTIIWILFESPVAEFGVETDFEGGDITVTVLVERRSRAGAWPDVAKIVSISKDTEDVHFFGRCIDKSRRRDERRMIDVRPRFTE
jgi:hypothetical protein